MTAELSPSLAPRLCSPEYVVDAVCELVKSAAVTTFLDVGCGDGKVLLAVARRTRVRCVGFDNCPAAIAKAKAAVEAAGLESLVEVEHQNAMDVELIPDSFIYVYLLPQGLQKLAPKLQAALDSGCVVASYIFRLPYSQETICQRVTSKDPKKMDVSEFSKIYVYGAFPAVHSQLQ